MHTVDQTATSGKCFPTMKDGYAQVSYNVRAIHSETGESMCGTSIPKGTPVRFEFIPHVSSDIYWFATGVAWDSPYGDWGTNAQTPFVIKSTPSFCIAKNYYSGVEVPRYASLTVHPPEKTLTNFDGFLCEDPDALGSRTCVAEVVGSTTPVFNFSATYGYMYGAFSNTKSIDKNTKDILPGKESACDTYTQYGRLRFSTVTSSASAGGGTGWSSCRGEKPFTLSVPERSISCPITIIDTPGGPPASPVIQHVQAQCVVGSQFTIEVAASDPDDDKVRFLIDWDNDLDPDERIPASFVPSGTVVSAARTFAESGEKVINVRAQDETGLLSDEWSATIIDCLEDTNDELMLGGSTDASGGDSSNTGTLDEVNGVEDLSIRAIPSLVRKNSTSTIHWSSSGMTSCRVSGTNGDGCTGTDNAQCSGWDTRDSLIVTGKETSPIQTRTTYTLHCTNAFGQARIKRATVHIRPDWTEL